MQGRVPVQWAAFDGDHTPMPVDGSTATSGARTWTSAAVNSFLAQFQSTPPTDAASDDGAADNRAPHHRATDDCAARATADRGHRQRPVCRYHTGFGTSDGTRLQLYDCTGGWNQKWAYSNSTFVNPQSGKCLNVAGTGNGSGGEPVDVQRERRSAVAAPKQRQRRQHPVGRCLDAVGRGTATEPCCRSTTASPAASPTSSGRCAEPRCLERAAPQERGPLQPPPLQTSHRTERLRSRSSRGIAYPRELRVRAVQMVTARGSNYDSEWAAIRGRKAAAWHR
jgi:hypothetical protein